MMITKKTFVYYFLMTSLLVSCSNPNKKSHDLRAQVALRDTITTSSGLKYFYLKKGNGRMIEFGSAVTSCANLYIEGADTVLWTSIHERDSFNTNIQDEHSFIKGYIELRSYLVEGDEVVGILPASLAYGEGNGDIPAGATLIFNPMIIRQVSEPKIDITDTLFQIATTSSAVEAVSFYESIITGKLTDQYHTDLGLIEYSLFDKLRTDSLYQQMEILADHFEHSTEDISLFKKVRYWRILAIVKQERIEDAIAEMEPIIKEKDAPAYWGRWQQQLKEKIK